MPSARSIAMGDALDCACQSNIVYRFESSTISSAVSLPILATFLLSVLRCGREPAAFRVGHIQLPRDSDEVAVFRSPMQGHLRTGSRIDAAHLIVQSMHRESVAHRQLHDHLRHRAE